MGIKVIFFLQPNLGITLMYSLYIGSNFNGRFATAIAFTGAPHHSESAVADQNVLVVFRLKFIDFCEGVTLFTMKSVLFAKVAISLFCIEKLVLKSLKKVLNLLCPELQEP